MPKKNIIALFITVISVICMLQIAAVLMIHVPNWQINESIKQTIEKPREEWLRSYKNIPIKSNYKVVIISSKGVGEHTLSDNLIKAAQNIGWNTLSFENTAGNEEEILKFDPDFIILLTLYNNPSNPLLPSKYKKYVFLDAPKGLLRYSKFDYLNKKVIVKPTEILIKKADGFLCTLQNIEFMRKIISDVNKKFEIIPFYTYVPKTQYQSNQANKIITIGNNWDSLRTSDRYKKFFQMLSTDRIIEVYGPKKVWEYIEESWGGFIPSKDIITKIRENGVVLVIHTNNHIKLGLLTNRIMEAVSAGAMVISDRNPAVIEHFGDNVLYIDHTLNAEEIYIQIKTHFEWIKAHPEEVKAMTKRNHEVFIEKFTAEAGMINVAKMHEYILVNEKADK